MSLLSYASPWTNEHSDNGNVHSNNGTPMKKRVATMSKTQSATRPQANASSQSNARKTVKVRPSYGSISDEYDIYKTDEDDTPNRKPDTIDDVMSKQTETNTRINSILNKITSFSNDDRLGDFNPMPYPTTINRKNADQIVPPDSAVENMSTNPLLPNTGLPKFERGGVPSNGLYVRPSDGASGGSYANYREAYGREGLASMNSGGGKEPYYSKMGIGKTGDKMMDRLNYMTQMLESIQMEKTNHVTEEFILYTLLGVFMIYIVDGFSRGGKYVR
jgi:hypothetical protein